MRYNAADRIAVLVCIASLLTQALGLLILAESQ